MSSRINPYNTPMMNEVWEDVNEFKTEFLTTPYAGCITDGTGNTKDYITLTYWVLNSRYGIRHIANFSIDQFKLKLFTKMFQFAPTWSKRLEIQEKLRNLSETDILTGSKAIYNSAQNPSTAPSTSSLDELTYINGQNTTNYKKSKMEAYAQLWTVLDNDVTNDYLSQFEKLFSPFASMQHPVLYDYGELPEDEDEGE